MSHQKKRKKSLIQHNVLADYAVDAWLTVEQINLYILKQCFHKGDVPPIPLELISLCPSGKKNPDTICVMQTTKVVEIKSEIRLRQNSLNDVSNVLRDALCIELGKDRQASDVADIVISYIAGQPRDLIDLIVWPRLRGRWDWRSWYFKPSPKIYIVAWTSD